MDNKDRTLYWLEGEINGVSRMVNVRFIESVEFNDDTRKIRLFFVSHTIYNIDLSSKDKEHYSKLKEEITKYLGICI